MTEIWFVKGDATRPAYTDDTRYIVHVCNDAGGWGKGFVVALSRRWSEPEQQYRQWYARKDEEVVPPFELGQVLFVPVREDIVVANMIAQHSYYPIGESPYIRYDALSECLFKVSHRITEAGEGSVHMPRIGCGLAGGDWNTVEQIVKNRLCDQGVPVTVYDL